MTNAILEDGDLPFKVDFLPSWATTVRRELMKRDDLSHPPGAHIQCTEVMHPKAGSYNIVFPLQFNDGVCWVLKVPRVASHDNFNASAAQTWISEARTMQLLKRETTIPIPTVHDFNASIYNKLQCPFILMDFIDGIPLPKVWFDHLIPQDALDKRRMQALQDLAEAMVQMGKFTFPQSGSPQFDSQGNVCGIGFMRRLDIAASLSTTTQDPEKHTDVMCDLGPFHDSKSYMLSLLDRRNSPPDQYSRGIYQLLRLFIEWLSEISGFDNNRFVLCHPDLDIQNILVNQDGRICGIIDWEGVAALPECSGNLCYPSFLTRDWDPLVYSYNPEDPNGLENSPEELQNLRAIYHDMIQNLLLEANGSCSSSVNESSKWTRRSLVIENVRIAADNATCTHGIVEKIFEKIEEFMSKQGWGSDVEDFYLFDIVCDLDEGTLDEGTLEVLKEGLMGLCEAG